MPKKRNARPKSSATGGKAHAKGDAKPKASEEFGGEIYAGDDWNRLKRKHPGGFQATLADLEKKDWDDGPAWYAELEGHDKLAKISQSSGRALAEVFGDNMESWKGQTVHITPTKYNVGWGAVIDPVEGDDEEDEVSLDNDDNVEDESDDDEVD